MSIYIVSILVKNRIIEAEKIQKILTEFGCNIHLRVGLHELSNQCSDEGLILIEFISDDNIFNDFINKLKTIEHTNVQYLKIK